MKVKSEMKSILSLFLPRSIFDSGEVDRFEMICQLDDVIFLHYFEATCSESSLELSIFEQRYTIISKYCDIARRSLEPIILDNLSDSFLVDSHDRQSEGHSFDDGNPLSFCRGSGEEESRTGKQIRVQELSVWNLPEKEDILFDAELSGELLETLALWTIADNHEANLRNLVSDTVYRANTYIVALLAGEPPDRTDDMRSIWDTLYMDEVGFCFGRKWVREERNLRIWDPVTREFYERILARRYDMFAVLVEKVIVLPAELAEDTEIIKTDDLQISFVRYVGMECTNSWYLHEFPEDDSLPSEDELRMVVDDIRLELSDLFDERWSEGKSDFEVWIEKCGKSFDGDDLDTWIVKVRNTRIGWDHYTHLMSPICELASKRNNARNNTIGRRVECIGEINEAHDIKTSRYNGKCGKN